MALNIGEEGKGEEEEEEGDRYGEWNGRCSDGMHRELVSGVFIAVYRGINRKGGLEKRRRVPTN